MVQDRILIVDDEEAIRFVLEAVMTRMGLPVSGASSIEEALARISEESFALALLDVLLPDGNGIALLDRIKQSAPDTEVVIMTSHASVETAVKAIRNGAYDYLNKPFDIEDVTATVSRALEKRSLTVRNRQLLGDLESQNRELAAAVKRLGSLNAAGKAISGPHTLPELLRLFLDLVAQELDVDRASVMLLDDRGEMRIVAAHGVDDAIVRDTRVRIGEGIAGWVVQTGEPLLVDDVTKYSALAEGRPNLSQSFISAPIVLSVPIKSPDMVLGAINVTNRRSGLPFGQDAVDYLTGLAGQAAAAIERARHLQQLQDALESLTATREQLMAAERLKIMGELVAGVAHEFNSSLNGILGRVQLLRASIDGGSVDPESLRRRVETIECLTLEGAAAVRKVQDSVRIRKDHPVEPVDVNEVVRLAADLTRPKWKVESAVLRRPIDLRLELGEIPTTLGDPQELIQVVSNLILNAVDAMPTGGRIEIRTASAEAAIFLEVADNGIGMDEDVRTRIFEPLFTTKESGPGLGLSVAFGIVARMGGDLRVESRPGEGSRFLARIPVREPSRAGAYGNRPDPTPSASDLRILVIEDEERDRELCWEILSTEGHRVALAGSGEEGLSALEATEFDVVITDLSLPGMSGWEVAEEVRKMEPAPSVVVLSGWGMQLEAQALERAGIALAVSKPASVEDLLDAVQRAARWVGAASRKP